MYYEFSQFNSIAEILHYFSEPEYARRQTTSACIGAVNNPVIRDPIAVAGFNAATSRQAVCVDKVVAFSAADTHDLDGAVLVKDVSVIELSPPYMPLDMPPFELNEVSQSSGSSVSKTSYEQLGQQIYSQTLLDKCLSIPSNNIRTALPGGFNTDIRAPISYSNQNEQVSEVCKTGFLYSFIFQKIYHFKLHVSLLCMSRKLLCLTG